MIRSAFFRLMFTAFTIGKVCAGAAMVLGQQNPSHSFGPGQCGPVDPAYISTANATGGVPLFLQRSEAGKAMQLMRESTRPNTSTVLWASAKLNGASQAFEIPVDSVMQRITFTFSVDTKGNHLVLKRPDGQVVGEGSAHTEGTELNCGRIITVDKPEPGTWRAEVSGSGTYWLAADGQSDIYFIKAEFVELGGRPGHRGLFRIQGQPIAGRPAILQASLSASEAKTTEFSLVSERGDPLQKLKMKVTDPDREFLEFTGDVTLPTVPFRIAFTGLDSKGIRYQRFNSPLSRTETVQVIPKLDFDELAPGTSKEAVFEVRNFGSSRNFKVTVTDAQRFITSVKPAELSIPENGSGSVHVRLAVPTSAKPYSSDDLVVVAQSTSGAATTNSAIARVAVSSEGADHSRINGFIRQYSGMHFAEGCSVGTQMPRDLIRIRLIAIWTLGIAPILLLSQTSSPHETPPDAPQISGVWRGRSECAAANSACRDEVNVYRISPKADKPGWFSVTGSKIVDGKEVVMGTSDWEYEEKSHSFTGDASFGSFELAVNGDVMQGTLTLKDGTVYRRIDLKREH